MRQSHSTVARPSSALKSNRTPIAAKVATRPAKAPPEQLALDCRVDALTANLPDYHRRVLPIATLRVQLEELRARANAAIDAAELALRDPFSLAAVRGAVAFDRVFNPANDAPVAELANQVLALVEGVQDVQTRETWGRQAPPECPGGPGEEIGCGAPVARGERLCWIHRAEQQAAAEVRS